MCIVRVARVKARRVFRCRRPGLVAEGADDDDEKENNDDMAAVAAADPEDGLSLLGTASVCALCATAWARLYFPKSSDDFFDFDVVTTTFPGLCEPVGMFGCQIRQRKQSSFLRTKCFRSLQKDIPVVLGAASVSQAAFQYGITAVTLRLDASS